MKVFCVVGHIINKLSGIFSTRKKAEAFIERIEGEYTKFIIKEISIDEFENVICWRVIYYLAYSEFRAIKHITRFDINFEDISVWYAPEFYHSDQPAQYIWTHVISYSEKSAIKLGGAIISKFLGSLPGKTLVTYKALKDNKDISRHAFGILTEDSFPEL